MATLLLILGLVALNAYQWSVRSIEAPELDRDRIVELYSRQAFWPIMNNRFMGIQTWQSPNDVWVTLEILWEVKPDFVVETGTHRGGSALLWATFLEQINSNARVVTIDIENKSQAARQVPIARRSVDFLVGSSTAPEIVEQVKRIVGGGRVVVILDSDHSRDHVLRELELYAPLVEPGSYLIVQDTAANGHPLLPEHGPGPWEALDVFLAKNTRFRSDRDRERLLFTLHPRGYLKRLP